MDADIRARFHVLVDGQSRTDKSVRELTVMLAHHVESGDTRFGRLEEAQLRTEQAIANLALSSDKRMTRIEENLEGLIRAITRDHSNGKSH